MFEIVEINLKQLGKGEKKREPITPYTAPISIE